MKIRKLIQQWDALNYVNYCWPQYECGNLILWFYLRHWSWFWSFVRKYYVSSLIIQNIVHSIDDRSEIAEADTTHNLERFAHSPIQNQLGFTRLPWIELYNQFSCKVISICPETVETFDMDTSVNTSAFTLFGRRVQILFPCNLIDYITRIRFSAISESSIHKFFSLWEIPRCDLC